MSMEADLPTPYANPRPGVVTALGILNVIFSSLLLIGLIFSFFWFYAMFSAGPAFSEPGDAPSENPSGTAIFGMNDPAFLRFVLIDVVTGLVLNLAMLASGIGLINLKGWGARLWTWTAWLKIVRLVLLWGFVYLVLVTPSFSRNMARAILVTINSGIGGRRGPTLVDLNLAYAIMNLILGVGMIVIGSLYPALSLWRLGRPGVRAALSGGDSREPERPAPEAEPTRHEGRPGRRRLQEVGTHLIDATSMLLGPLAAPECSRASRRGWLIWVRLFPAVVSCSAAFVVLWLWWIQQQVDPHYQPFNGLHRGLSIVEGMLATFALILAPAVLAGSLAGEKERGSIGLLLTTRVTSADIVLGTLAGRLSQVLMIEFAATPALLLFASLSGMGPLPTLALFALPMGLAIGSGGLALGASAMSRRGRDALLLVYLIEILALLVPVVATVPAWVALINPYQGLMALTWDDLAWPSLVSAGGWAMMGVSALALASWRLRPLCLAEGDGVKSRRKALRKAWVPPLDDRPMLWKELYIERVGTLGRVGRWIGALLVLWLGLGSVGLGILAAWDYSTRSDAAWASWSIQLLSRMYGNSALLISFLIEWAIGLRAAVAISSERERGTWDALLTSPLEGPEIVRAKLWGSLYALRWLIGSAVLAWTICLMFGAMLVNEYFEAVAGVALIGSFMAAAGVRTSLRSSTATRAMGLTIGVWLGALTLSITLAYVVCISLALCCLIGWMIAVQSGMVPPSTPPWLPSPKAIGVDYLFYGQFLVWTIAIVVETRLRFDRMAGRMTAGAAALAVERLIHGRPMATVRLDAHAKHEPSVEPELDGAIG